MQLAQSDMESAEDRESGASARADPKGADLSVRPGGGSPRVTLVPSSMPTNPYPSLLARAIERAGATLVDDGRPNWAFLFRQRGRVEVLHLHWLHVFYRADGQPIRSTLRAIGFALWLVAARLLGYRLVWTLHNDRPHDSPTPLADDIARRAAMNLSSVVIHCEAARQVLQGQKHFGSVHSIPHGSYVGVYPDTVARDEARRRLAIEEDRTVFLAFGLIRRYKGLERLIETFEELSRDPAFGDRATLVVAGRPRTEEDARWVSAMRERVECADVRWTLEFIDDADVQLYMRAADFAVTAFERILVSGSAIIALGFDLPVVAPTLGSLPELLDGGSGILYDPETGLAGALREALRVDRAPMVEAARRRVQELDWDAIGRAHVRVYEAS